MSSCQEYLQFDSSFALFDKQRMLTNDYRRNISGVWLKYTEEYLTQRRSQQEPGKDLSSLGKISVIFPPSA